MSQPLFSLLAWTVAKTGSRNQINILINSLSIFFMIEKSYYIVYNMTGTIKGTVTGTIKGKRTNKPRHNKTVKTRNNKIDIIYWINMEKSRTRRTHMMTVLKDDTFDNIEKKRIVAVDGSEPNMETYFRSIFENMDLRKRNVKEYACLVSHLNTLIEFSKSDHNIALIFEDDVSLEYKKYWTKSLNQVIENAPKDWEVLQLCIIIDKDSVLANDKKQKPLYVKGYAASAAAYIVNKKGVLRFLHKFYESFRKCGKFVLDKKISHHADVYLFEKMKTYVYRYPLFTYLNKETTLHPKDLITGHTFSKKIVDELVKNHYMETANV